MKIIKIITIVIYLTTNLSISQTNTNTHKEEIESFILNAMDLMKVDKYEDFVNLYITEQEYVNLYKKYGYPENYAKSKYIKNSSIPEKDWFVFKVDRQFYNCKYNYRILENNYPETTRFSKIFNLEKIADSDEYYFAHAVFTIQCTKNNKTDQNKSGKDINFGEIIRIPNKGWRLVFKPM